MSLKVISLFSGCGGSSLGYKMADCNVVASCEFDDNAAKTYQLNFPSTKLFLKSVVELKAEELKACYEGELDILDGSPPCQGFSTIGKRDFSDSRNQLFQQYVRILRELKPKVFVMENVSGMIKGNMKFTFVEILKSLKEVGYKVKCKLMNAKYYGVPQTRQRVIFIGIRNDLAIEPSFPMASSKVISVEKSLTGCMEDERMQPKGFCAKIAAKLRQGESASKYHPKKHFFSTYRLHAKKPSPTIIKTFHSSQIFVFHPTLNQSISIAECKRLCSFPDDFKMIGTFVNKWARLGNSVPPLLIKAIAEHLKKTIFEEVS